MAAKYLRWLRLALKDIEQLTSWLELNVDEETANLVTERILDAVEGLKLFPDCGRIGKVNNTRELAVPKTSHYIVYRLVDNEVQILRIIHNSRNYPTTS